MTTKTSPHAAGVKIKKEIGSDEIKDFAETAMNELLGWYGYDNVDRIELQPKPKPSQLISALNSTDNSRNELNNGSHSHRGDSTSPDRDSSREDSKSPSSAKNSEKLETHCGWCRRLVPSNSPEFLTTPDGGPRYCSESCFAQSRRASFKRAKTCDWCRHVRHAVSYVDFQDGASQLQFCSDKCLNQYKMQIFCRETQAHLDMNPHLKDKGVDTSSGLITPDLWLKNCRSRSVSPDHSDLSRSPTPTQNAATSQQTVHKPVISVAPASKLLSRSTIMGNSRQSPKHSRKKRFTRMNISHNSIHNNNNNSNNINNNSSSSCNLSNTVNNRNSSPASSILVNSLSNLPMTSKPCTFTNVQDLRLGCPPISPTDGSHSIRPNINPSFFSPPPPNAFNLRPPFFPNHPHPRLMGIPPHHQLPPMPPVDLTGLSSLLGTAPPPVTVMVPYPIIIPIPIPIPIPLPILDFIKAAELRKNGTMPAQPAEHDPRPDDENNEPLDFTKSKSNLAGEPAQIIVDVTPEEKARPTVEEASTVVEEEEVVVEKEAVPKLKITRLNSRRPVNVSREAENCRPLRKRKRVIDCDYLRSSKDDEDTTRHKK